MTDSLIQQIAQGGVAFSVMLLAIIYFVNREKKKDKEIENLNKTIREIEKENLKALYSVLNYLEKSSDKYDNSFIQLKNDIDVMRQSIENKIENLK